ncbi:MAG: hypothetical protein A2V90_08780 [Gammaproteobacteria bacterium RBG_16_57_12]|nr:MAG: hypothetical protein A2V90_08780 [Gammaproteobacteria bacterium RBG_16_57_12]
MYKEQNPMDEVPKQKSSISNTLATFISAPTLFSLALGITLSIGLFSLVKGWEETTIKAEFGLAAGTYAADLKGELNRHLEGVSSIARYFDSSESVQLDEFNTFVGGYLEKHFDIQALVWMPRITAAERAHLEQRARAEGQAEFRITEKDAQGQLISARTREEYFPASYVYPYNSNEMLLGYDLASDVNLRQDMESSRNTGAMIVTRRLKLFQDTGDQYSVIIFAPVYRKNAPTDTPEQRHANLLGFAAEVMNIGTFIEEALLESATFGIDLLLTDKSASSDESFLYYHEQYSPQDHRLSGTGNLETRQINEANIEQHLNDHPHDVNLTWHAALDLPSRQWVLDFYPAEEFLAAHRIWSSWAILLSSLLLSAFLVFYLHRRNLYKLHIESFMAKLGDANRHLEDEIRERKHIEEALTKIAHAVNKKNSEEFFTSMVQNLTTALQVEFAFIGEVARNNKDLMEMVAVCKNGRIIDNFRCPLAGTACSKVIGYGTSYFPDSLQKTFAGDCLLCEAEAESYLGSPIYDSNGELLGIVGIMSTSPMTSNQPAEAVLHFYAEQIAGELQRRQSEIEMQKLSSALKQTADVVTITDRNGVIEYVNPTFETLTGYRHDEVVGKSAGILKSGKHDNRFYKNLWETIQGGGSYQGIIINRKKNGDLYYEEKTITPVKDRNGIIINYISTGKDITGRVEDQKRLLHLAYHDTLTELPNRMLLMDRLEHSLIRRTKSKLPMAIMFLDLDRFKNINDTLGHNVGDMLLQNVTKRLMACIREEDTIARLGGDEFAILLENIASVEDIVQVSKKILQALDEPFVFHGQELYISGSIGISIHPEDGNDASTLLMNADTAMYRAKALGRNNYQFYSPDMSAMALDRLKLESSLRRAIERQEFLLHYQPQVEMATGKIIGAEALLRWQHPERGMVAPMEFIPLLEETGLIGPVGEWVLRTACHQARHWYVDGFKSLRISANLSGRQFQDPKLVKIISDILEECALDSSLLELEITESVLMQGDKTSMNNLHTLKQMGLHLAIDDFGTGYSSLSYLKRFPITTLKIDREFIRDISTDEDDAAIVKTIVAMSHNLKMRVIAEGVETEQQYSFLKTCGCTNIQGNLFSVPLDKDEMGQLLRSNIH